MLSLKFPLGMQGGRTNTMSWRLDNCSCFFLKGQQDTRCSPAYFLRPMRSVENILGWPRCRAEGSNWRVSRRVLGTDLHVCIICANTHNMHYMQDILYLLSMLWSREAVNIWFIIRNCWKVEARVVLRIEFKQLEVARHLFLAALCRNQAFQLWTLPCACLVGHGQDLLGPLVAAGPEDQAEDEPVDLHQVPAAAACSTVAWQQGSTSDRDIAIWLWICGILVGI